jgi:hypothetical protein
MIRRNTWILLFLLVIVAAGAYYLNNRKAQQAASATPTAAGGAGSGPLFSATPGAPTDITVKDTTGKMVEVARNGSGAWVLKAPTNAQADQAAAEAAATQVTALRVLSSVQLDLNIVGLDKPTYIMAFTFKDGSKHTLNVGSVTPIQDGYYTSLDEGPVKIVDKPGLDALIQLLSQPPYVATPTPPITETPAVEPSASPLPAPTDTPEATASPAPTASSGPTATP